MKTCPKCHQQIEDNSIYCEFCGHDIGKSRKIKKIVLVSAVVLLLIAAVVVLILNIKDSPKEDITISEKEPVATTTVKTQTYVNRYDSLRASHILISYLGAVYGDNVTRTREEAEVYANSLLVSIKRGGDDVFENLAKTVSEDPGTKDVCGDIGWFPPGTMVPDFENYVASVNLGEVGIVETPFGYHIVKVTGKAEKGKKPESLPDNNAAIQSSIANTAQNSAGSTLDKIETPVSPAPKEEETPKKTVKKTQGSLNEHDWVDLGLPSGTLWATCNVGASRPNDYGNYYAWGETNPKRDYSWETYKFSSNSEESMTKYCTDASWSYYGTTDNIRVLQSQDDAATVNWGAGWRTPTKNQWEELGIYCEWKWIINGYKVIGDNGNSIFLPSAGYYLDYDSNQSGKWGNYWSSSLIEDAPYRAWCLTFSSHDYHIGDYRRRCGASVRAVTTDN